MKNILSIAVLAGLTTAYSGDLTYYADGVGSCGLTKTDSDAIVALSLPMVCILGPSFQYPGPMPEFQDVLREQQTALNTSPICVIFGPLPCGRKADPETFIDGQRRQPKHQSQVWVENQHSQPHFRSDSPGYRGRLVRGVCHV